MTLPTQPLEPAQIEAALTAFAARDLPWRDGRTYAYVYDAGREVERIGTEAFAQHLFTNALDPTAFPSALALENEVVGFACAHLGGGPEAVGTFTSGGTESIICAVKAARDHARATRPEVARPEVILPTTAHPAFHKAAHYLGLEVVAVDVDPVTFRADPAALARAIGPNTILLVGSAPSYPHGVIDPIEDLAALAEARGLWLHVDACVGGFLLPYWRRLGADVPAFDLSVPGVTSISMDFHKYGFAPKGASVVVYRDAAARRFQYFGCAAWPGYTVVNPGVMSSKSAGPLAATWAVLQRLGDEGYLDLAQRSREGTRRLVEGIAAIPGIRVLGQPDFCMVAFASDPAAAEAPGVFHVADELNARGWFVQPQLSFRNCQDSVHLSLGPENAARVDELLTDLRAAVEAARQQPTGELAALVSAQLAGRATPPGPEELAQLLALAGLTGDGLPARMAPVLEVLSALPRPFVSELLVDYLAGLFAPAPAAVCP
ncbi:MAG: aspartate aminotransferase family protein [Planctomycetota bacterium]